MGIAVIYDQRSKGFGLWDQAMEVIYKSRHIVKCD